MIAYLDGKLAQIDPSFAIIECNGIGYLVKISLNTFSQIKEKEKVKLLTYFQVREDAQVLYGFSNAREKVLFEQLIGISGVGGNTAIMILSSISPEELYMAIQSEDTMALKRVKGIGAKTAGRIVLELKDKIKLDGEIVSPGVGQKLAESSKKQEALTALANLGLPKNQMSKRIDKILSEAGGDLSVEQIIKQALRNP
ncbi:MAG: Holliday junction branch migration protein RuvA [Bacteroidia bacterium]|nr:Holliday junction branch migration protein RuvA [Bacteroidia bacterium]